MAETKQYENGFYENTDYFHNTFTYTVKCPLCQNEFVCYSYEEDYCLDLGKKIKCKNCGEILEEKDFKYKSRKAYLWGHEHSRTCPLCKGIGEILEEDFNDKIKEWFFK